MVAPDTASGTMGVSESGILLSRFGMGFRYDSRDERRGEVHAMDKYVIKLYVTGQTPRSQRAIDNLRRICEEELRGQYDLVVIDVLERPQLAEDEKILATPTVVKELPPPIRRIIGDLSDAERVLVGLDLHASKGSVSVFRTD